MKPFLLHRFVALAGGLTLFACWPMSAKEFQGASYQDIISSLGPDALGLNFIAERLPDVNELAASRLEGQGSKFIVEHPYTGGRWKGGKAVIEYARDLSYAIVSIYDKEGNRQRIYSVKARPRETPITVAQGGTWPDPSEIRETPDDNVPPVDNPTASNSPAVAPAPAPPVPVPPVEEAAPVQAAASSSSSSPSSRKGRHDKKGSSSSAPIDDRAEVAADAAAQTNGFVWNDQVGAYVPVGGGSASSAEPDSVPSFPTSGNAWSAASNNATPPPLQTPPALPGGRHTKKSNQAVADTTIQEPQSPSTSNPGSVNTASATAPEDVPSTDQLLSDANNAGNAGGGSATPSVSPPAPAPAQASNAAATSSKKSGHRHASSSSSPAAAAPVVNVATSGTNPPADDGDDDWVPKNTALTAEKPDTAEPDVHDVNIPKTPEEAKAAREALESDSWTPQDSVARNPANADQTAPPPAGGKRSSKPTAPVVDQTPPDSSQPLESDSWNPKATPKPAPVPDLPPATQQVAMLPKTQAPPDTSIDALLKAAAAQRASAPSDGDQWSPKNIPAANPDADINQELAKVRAEKPVVKPVVKINRDVNNPEAGVLPVNSFEKFSGPRYGRHREYERRFYYGQKPGSAVAEKDYDFYVDEVDRKHEFHNIYYYKKGKIPKLVAVEKHERVSFLTNYDVDKEDKGKITRG